MENTFNETQRTVKVGDLLPKLKEVFKETKETEKYIRLFELLKDETVYSFITMIQFMPRAIEQYFTQDTDKHPILDMDISKILG